VGEQGLVGGVVEGRVMQILERRGRAGKHLKECGDEAISSAERDACCSDACAFRLARVALVSGVRKRRARVRVAAVVLWFVASCACCNNVSATVAPSIDRAYLSAWLTLH
jgi:hypothetical protein